MIRNTHLFAIFIIFLFLNIIYFTSHIPKPGHVYHGFKYALAGNENKNDPTGAAFVDSLTKEIGIGDTSHPEVARAGDKTPENHEAVEHVGHLPDEETARQNMLENPALIPGVEKAGIGKAIGQPPIIGGDPLRGEIAAPQPAAAQAELAPHDGSHRDEGDGVELEQIQTATLEDSAQQQTAPPSSIAVAPAQVAVIQMENSLEAEAAPSSVPDDDHSMMV